MADYTIAQGLGVRERMNLLADYCSAGTAALLDKVGVAVGGRCLDIGCGGGHVTRDLARRVGPAGSVLGIDVDHELLAVATKEAADEGLTNIEFRVAKAEDLAERDFDVAYARCLLMHLDDPQHVVDAMAAALKPGGVVIVEDCHFGGAFTAPACPAFDRIVGWYVETVCRRGGDANIGRRLPVLLDRAGLTCLGIHAVQPPHLDGPHKHLVRVSADKFRDAVVGDGVADLEAFNRAHAELIAFTEDPVTLIAGPHLVQAWGQRAVSG